MNCDDGILLQAVAALLMMVAPEYVATLTDAVFFCTVREYLIQDMLIGTYRDAAAARLGTALGMLSTTIVTLWVLYQGFMVISGTNRQPFTGLLFKTAKLVFLLSLVSLVARQSPAIADTVLDFQRLVTTAVVGEDTNVYRMIDINLGLAQVINQVINNLAGGQQAGVSGNSLTTAAGLLGQSGPAMITTVLALLAEIAITFAIMLAPLFIFFLLFQQTSSLFWSWAKFLLGAFVSLAALAVVSGIALRMSAIYGASVLAAYYANGSEGLGSIASFDISGSAMRMATLGTLMSAIIISVPPMVMQFFNAGVGFATGAMGGMIGGAMAGRMAGGGTGIPGMAYGGAGALGAGQGAQGESGYLTPPPSLPAPANGPSGDGSTGIGGQQVSRTTGHLTGGDSTASVGAAPGTRGLASENSSVSRLEQINDVQARSTEFRDFDTANTQHNGQGSWNGRGGHLGVSGAANEHVTPAAASSGSRASHNGTTNTDGGGGSSSRPENPDTSVHRTLPPGATPTPPAQSETASRPQVPWGQRNTEGVRS
ncbi:type IV secretion system protein [Hydrogenophaga sp.]|uniref:type IV secretion system protein n=1 Tax=Hydrogenophaga sp. TaxID=1904254 RepID=UPI0027201A37|nr:type IV secretion system protein [Hydrogenophaga sp.]MDO8906032.1 type IV secretion system protein [Hydrogenophaga sp.]